MSLGDTVQEMAASLRDCLMTELNLRPDPPAEVTLVSGEDGRLWLTLGTAENRCCSGFAWVRVAGVAPRIPESAQQSGNCAVTTWQLDLEMGVARCAPWGDTARGPSVVELTAGFVQQQRDAEAMRAALCCLRPLVQSGRTFPTPWVPFGPDGGCQGGAMGVSIELDDCDCDN